MGFFRQKYWSGLPFPIQGIFPTQVSNPYLFSSVQPLSHVQLFLIPWTAASQTSLSITSPWSLFNLMSMESVVPSKHPLSSFSPSTFNFSQHQGLFKSQFFTSGGQSIGASASASVFPMNIQDWFPLGWTGWISLQAKDLSRVFNNIVQKHQFFSAQLSL